MIVSVYGPCGIVTASTCNDRFYETQVKNGQSTILPIDIPGLPHTYVFWNKYVLIYNYMNSYSIDATTFVSQLKYLEDNCKEVPSISEFMPYIKKIIVDNKFQILGIVTGYNINNNNNIPLPHVYMILGESIRRINQDSAGNVIFNCIYLEKTPIIGKLMQRIKILNGSNWDDCDEILPRFDFFSIEKSIDLCAFFLKTHDYIEDINSKMFKNTLEVDLVIHCTNKIELKKIHI